MTGVHHQQEPLDQAPGPRHPSEPFEQQLPQPQWSQYPQQPVVGHYHQQYMGVSQPYPGQQSPSPGAMRNGFGVAAIILAVAGIVFTFPLITGSIAVILGVLGLVFGAVGWVRARRGEASNRRTALTAWIVGAIVSVIGLFNVVILMQTAAPAIYGTSQASSNASSAPTANPYVASSPYVGAPAAPVAAKPTSYTYEVTGNYRATQLSFTDSNGDSVQFNNTSDTRTSGSTLPWSKTVSPEPNGKGQYLNAQTMSTKGDSWITCTVKDDKGAVVATDTGKGAYATCMTDTPMN